MCLKQFEHKLSVITVMKGDTLCQVVFSTLQLGEGLPVILTTFDKRIDCFVVYFTVYAIKTWSWALNFIW